MTIYDIIISGIILYGIVYTISLIYSTYYGSKNPTDTDIGKSDEL